LGILGNPVAKQRGGEVSSFASRFLEVTQKVKNEKKHSGKARVASPLHSVRREKALVHSGRLNLPLESVSHN
jgi:hypothetical protein